MIRPRHSRATRLWHWLNVICLTILLMSGLNISNAHPWLYWGHAGFDPAQAWLALPKFPGWVTIPDYYSLGQARRWHFIAAWPFALGLTGYLLWGLVSGHFRRVIALWGDDWRWQAIREDIAAHARLDFSAHGAASYNFLQKLLYGLVIFIGLPLMILSGLALSPTMDAGWPWLVDMFGGRQSARSIHVIMAALLVLFFIIHIVAVALTGPLRLTWEMITGGKAEQAE